jgi:hypothetical protein
MCEYDAKNMLTFLALSDCKHDFDKEHTFSFTTNIENLFGNRQCIGSINIYNHFKNKNLLENIIPFLEQEDAQTEDQILDSVTCIRGFYNSIKEYIVNRNIISNIHFNRKQYSITYAATKINTVNGSIANAFKETSNNNTFIVLYDYSFFHWQKLIEDTNPNESYTFYIIINNEQLADSANDARIDITNSASKRITIFYLVSTETKTYDTTSELHSVHDYPLNNIDGKINTIYNDKIYKDMKQISNINAASLLACQKQYPNYLFFKRAGDWCQALSLLDESRTYKIFDKNYEDTREETTIAQLKRNSELALITHDKVLLAYSLFLGINVFYSIGFENNSTVFNVFFKNTTKRPDRPVFTQLRPPRDIPSSTIPRWARGATGKSNIFPEAPERPRKRERPIGGGNSLKTPAEKKIKTPYVNDDSANFYTVTPDNIYITQTQLDSLVNELVELPQSNDEIYYCYRFIFYYLDEIYTRIFLLAGQHETYQDDLHYVYLKLVAELFNIYDNILVKNQNGGQLNVMNSFVEDLPMLPSNYVHKAINLNGPITLKNIKKIEDIYVEHRNTWTFEYLKNFEHVLKGNLFDMDKQLSEFHKKLHDFVMVN